MFRNLVLKRVKVNRNSYLKKTNQKIQFKKYIKNNHIYKNVIFN